MTIDIKKLFKTFDYSRADLWMSRHSDFKNESSEDNFDNGRALEEIIQWASHHLLSRDPGKNGYDLLAIDDTTFECKKVNLNAKKPKFVIKNAHPNSKKPPKVVLADYYVLGDYQQRKILVIPKSKVKVVATVKDAEKSDYHGYFQWTHHDIVWIGNPKLQAEESWASIKGQVRDLLYHNSDDIIEPAKLLL
jgi:hypothetical protein